MAYPALTMDKAQELADLLRVAVSSGGDPLLEHITEEGWVQIRNGHDYEPALVTKCGFELQAEVTEKLKASGKLSAAEAYKLESKMAGLIHDSLSQLGMDMLEDEDFWRYLALFPFRWYLLAREPELQPQDFGGYVEIEHDSGVTKRVRKAMITQLILRTFLWGKIAFEEEAKDPYHRATIISEINGPAIDIWHSHMIRTQLGQLGLMKHAFIDVIVEKIEDPESMKDPARKIEKLIARVKHNVLLDIYSKKEADSIVGEQFSNI